MVPTGWVWWQGSSRLPFCDPATAPPWIICCDWGSLSQVWTKHTFRLKPPSKSSLAICQLYPLYIPTCPSLSPPFGIVSPTWYPNYDTKLGGQIFISQNISWLISPEKPTSQHFKLHSCAPDSPEIGPWDCWRRAWPGWPNDTPPPLDAPPWVNTNAQIAQTKWLERLGTTFAQFCTPVVIICNYIYIYIFLFCS